jgi:putative pyruvate formate lyase activating enzyme
MRTYLLEGFSLSGNAEKIKMNYINLYKSGKLKKKIKAALNLLKKCSICPNRCGVNRLKDKKGICKTGRYAFVASYNPHFGEEAPLVGRYGSGTIFFSNCNLKCVFCQNYDISQMGYGKEMMPEELAKIMINLQNMECHNINFVSPTHIVPQILEALEIAIENGLNLPLVYNSNGYDEVHTLKLLDGIIDIYMPDFKYGDDEMAEKYSGIKNYFNTAGMAIKEMQRQVGDLIIENGIAKKGLIIRHLVLPENIAGSEKVIKFIAENISKNVYLNIMLQYRPEYKAYKFKELNRSISMDEYEKVIDFAKKYGLERVMRNS